MNKFEVTIQHPETQHKKMTVVEAESHQEASDNPVEKFGESAIGYVLFSTRRVFDSVDCDRTNSPIVVN